MPTKPSHDRRKTRTREHVIADLAVNHVERFILHRGHTLEHVRHDYGIDLIMFGYNEQGEQENGQILLQVKATDALSRVRDGRFIAWRLDRRDLRNWLNESDPVLLIVYGANEDKAYWCYIQAYFAVNRPIDLFSGGGTFTIHIPIRNRVNLNAVDKFNGFRENVTRQLAGRVQHHE